MKEYNVLIGNGVQESDKELFFGPLTKDDKFITMQDNVRWPDVLVECNIFKSKNDARRNGWNKEIEEGFTDRQRLGKLKHRIIVLKILGEKE